MSEAQIERSGEAELRLRGVLDYRSGPALREVGRSLIAGGRSPLTLDCSAVERSSSVGLSLLLACWIFNRLARVSKSANQ